MKRLRRPTTWIVVGWVLAGLGVAASVLMVLQPWRSCADDDAAAGCPVTVVDANLTVAALAVLGAGILLVLGTVFRPRPLPLPGLRKLPRRPGGR